VVAISRKTARGIQEEPKVTCHVAERVSEVAAEKASRDAVKILHKVPQVPPDKEFRDPPERVPRS
jgi:hypothetical protein